MTAIATVKNAKVVVGDFGLQILIFSIGFLGFVWIGFIKGELTVGIIIGAFVGLVLAFSTIIVD